MNGRMVLRFSKDVTIPEEGLKDRMKITVIPGVYSDPEVLKFDYEVVEVGSKDVDIQFTFE